MELLTEQLVALQRGGDRVDLVRSRRIETALAGASLDLAPSPGSVTAPSSYRRQLRSVENWPIATDPNVRLVEAVASHDPDAVESALEAGADPHFRCGPLDEPVLSHAVRMGARTGDSSIVSMLLSAGADPNEAGRSGETPLHVAAASGSPQMVDLLVAHGADPFRRDRAGRTPRELAVAVLGRHQVASHAVFAALDKAERGLVGPGLPERQPRSQGSLDRG